MGQVLLHLPTDLILGERENLLHLQNIYGCPKHKTTGRRSEIRTLLTNCRSGAKENRAKLGRKKTAGGAAQQEHPAGWAGQALCSHNSSGDTCRAGEGTCPPLLDELCGFCRKKKKNPFPGGKECFGSGLDSGPIRFECLERLWRLDWGQRGEGSFCPSNQSQRVRPLVLQAQDAPNPLSASQQGQPGTGTQESTSWPAALCLWHKEHTGVGAPQRKPKKSILQAGAAPQDVPQSHTPSQHIMCSCSSCRQLL